MRNLPKLPQSLGHVHDTIFKNLGSRDTFRTILSYTIPGHLVIMEVEIRQRFLTHRFGGLDPSFLYHTIQLSGTIRLIGANILEESNIESYNIFTKQVDSESNFVPWTDDSAYDIYKPDMFASEVIGQVHDYLNWIDRHACLAFQHRDVTFYRNPEPSFLDYPPERPPSESNRAVSSPHA